MRDINGMPLKVGDKVTTSSLGACEILSLIAPDNNAHQGALVKVRTHKGSKTDIRLKLVQATYISTVKPTGFTLGDMVRGSFPRLSLKRA